MRATKNTSDYLDRPALAILAGWSPSHRSLEAEAAELADISERDNAARATFARRQVRHG